MRANLRLPPVRRTDDWVFSFNIRDVETGDPFDLTGSVATLSFETICGWPETIGGTDTGEVSFPALGVVLCELPAPRLSRYCEGVYPITLVLQRDGYTETIVSGLLPITN